MRYALTDWDEAFRLLHEYPRLYALCHKPLHPKQRKPNPLKRTGHPEQTPEDELFPPAKTRPGDPW